MTLIYEKTTEAIIGAAYEVYNQLGYGFLEKVYQKAMQVELLGKGHSAIIEHGINVRYKDVIVGEYFADLFVDEKVIVELKTAQKYNIKDEPQLLNELKATGIKIGILINFERKS